MTAKSNYFRRKLDENMGEPEKLWKYIKDLSYSTKSSSKAKIVLNIDSVIQSDTLAVCNYVNSFLPLWLMIELVNYIPEVSNYFRVRSDSFERF